MLQALTSVSRARRRPLEPSRAPLRLLLGGHLVISDDVDLRSQLVSTDPIAVREILDAMCGDDPAEILVRLTDDYAVLRLPLDDALAEVRGAPLAALAGSLQMYSGTLVEALAAGQTVLERIGGRIVIEDDGVHLWLPLTAPANSVALEDGSDV